MTKKEAAILVKTGYLLQLLIITSAVLFLCPGSSEGGTILLKKIRTVPAGRCPKGIAMSPDGKYAAVTNLEGGNVLFYDTKTGKPVKKIQFTITRGTGFDYQQKKRVPSFREKPVECIFSKDGKWLFISLHNDCGIAAFAMENGRLDFPSLKKAAVIDLVTGEKYVCDIPYIRTGITPKVMTFSPDGKYLYVSNWHSGNISVIETDSLKKLYDFWDLKQPRGISYYSRENYILAANFNADYITVLDTRKRTSAYLIRTGKNPRHIIQGADEDTFFVSLASKGYVAKINMAKRKITGMAKVGNSPRTIAITYDGQYLFSANYYDNTVSVVDTSTMKQTGCYTAGVHPCGLCITTDNKELWVTNYLSNDITIFRIQGKHHF